MNSNAPVLVIGGTRGTGLLIARLLHARGWSVRVLARIPRRAAAVLDPAITIVEGDLTQPKTLGPAAAGIQHLVLTAGCRSGYPVGRRRVEAVEYGGVVSTLAALRQTGFAGRLLYMNSSGVSTSSRFAACLNLWKGNTLVCRRRAEGEIRRSGVDYTIIRAGVLLNQPGGQHRIHVTQQPLPLSLRYRIARADVAELFVTALAHPATRRTTFEAVWEQRGRVESWQRLLDGLAADKPEPLKP